MKPKRKMACPRLNLKREFPRVPFYPDFACWAAWGERLMGMHVGYEAVEPWPVVRVEEEVEEDKKTLTSAG